jgi:hypothetical protein
MSSDHCNLNEILGPISGFVSGSDHLLHYLEASNLISSHRTPFTVALLSSVFITIVHSIGPILYVVYTVHCDTIITI